MVIFQNNYHHKTFLDYEYWGEVDSINIVRNSSLWSDVVFEKEAISLEFDLETSSLEFDSVFSFINISQIRQPIDLKFAQVCFFMHMLRYTKWEDWSLTITNIIYCLEWSRKNREEFVLRLGYSLICPNVHLPWRVEANMRGKFVSTMATSLKAKLTISMLGGVRRDFVLHKKKSVTFWLKALDTI